MVLFNPQQGGRLRAYTISKSICLKVSIIGWLEFELAYFGTAVQHMNHYATGTIP